MNFSRQWHYLIVTKITKFPGLSRESLMLTGIATSKKYCCYWGIGDTLAVLQRSQNVRLTLLASLRKTLAVVSLVSLEDKRFPLSAALSRATSSSFHLNRERVSSAFIYWYISLNDLVLMNIVAASLWAEMLGSFFELQTDSSCTYPPIWF